MSIKLAVTGRPEIVLGDEDVLLGSDPDCSVAFPDLPDVRPKHAVIRPVGGRWLLEVRQAESVLIGGTQPKRMHWLTPGDVICLTENGPKITFQPTDGQPVIDDSPPLKLKTAPAANAKKTLAPQPSHSPQMDVILASDSDEEIPAVKSVESAKASAAAKPKTKPPSSAIIPVVKSDPSTSAPLLDDSVPLKLKDESSSSEKRPPAKSQTPMQQSDVILPPISDDDIPVAEAPKAVPPAKPRTKPPSSATIPTKKAPSSAMIPTTKSPGEKSPGTPKSPSSTTIPAAKAPGSRTIPTSNPPPSTTIRTTKPPSSTTIKTQGSSDAIPMAKKSQQLSRGGANSPAGKSKGDVPTFDRSITSDPAAGAPVLKRLSSWEVPIPKELAEEGLDEAWEGGARRRKSKFANDADVKYIKKVVISCAAIALGILILFHGYRELRRALNPPQYNAPSTSMMTPDQSRARMVIVQHSNSVPARISATAMLGD